MLDHREYYMFEKEILRLAHQIHEETEVTRWFIRFHNQLGFSDLKGPYSKGADYEAIKDGKKVGIEIEWCTFNLWKHSPEVIRTFDYVVTYAVSHPSDLQAMKRCGITLIECKEDLDNIREECRQSAYWLGSFKPSVQSVIDGWKDERGIVLCRGDTIERKSEVKGLYGN